MTVATICERPQDEPRICPSCGVAIPDRPHQMVCAECEAWFAAEDEWHAMIDLEETEREAAEAAWHEGW